MSSSRYGLKSFNPLYAATNPAGFVKQWQTNIAVGSYIVHHPSEVAKAIVKPYVDDWTSGHPLRAIGRGIVDIQTNACDQPKIG